MKIDIQKAGELASKLDTITIPQRKEPSLIKDREAVGRQVLESVSPIAYDIPLEAAALSSESKIDPKKVDFLANGLLNLGEKFGALAERINRK